MHMRLKSPFYETLEYLFPRFKKICIVTNCFPPCPKDASSIALGGISKEYERIVDELRYFENKFHIISLYYKNISKNQDSSDVSRIGVYRPYTVSRFKHLYPLLEFFNPLIFIRCLRVLTKQRPDLVIIGETLQMSLSPIFAAKILGIDVVIQHDWICPLFSRGWACDFVRRLKNCGECLEVMMLSKQNKLVKICFGIFSAIMFIIKRNIWNGCTVFPESKYYETLYIQWGIKPNIIYRVPASPTVDKFTRYDLAFEEKLRKQVGSSKVLVYVGRLSQEKGVNMLFQSYKILKGKNKKSIKLVIAGDGPLRDFVVGESSVDTDILYLGWLEKDKLRCVYSLADIVLIPSIYPEAYPHVALEALAFNKKIVGFQMGGLIDISKENSKIILVKNLNSEAYADEIMNNI